MAQLSLAMRAKPTLGKPLPTVFRQLDAVGAKIRRGQVSLIAGAPGRGKSALASHIARCAEVPTLYFSADTDQSTLGTRVLAGVIGKSLEETEEMVKLVPTEAWEEIDAATGHIEWDFHTTPTVNYIHQEINAYAIVFGRYPELVVVDNLMNVGLSDDESVESEAKGQDGTISLLADLARMTGAAVLILHHVNGGEKGANEDGKTPVPLSGLMNKVGKRPRLVITLHQSGEGILGASVVKNSSGPADPSGKSVMAHIGWMPSRSWFSDGRV